MKIIEKYRGVKYATLIDSEISGPTLMSFGAIHGNEPSGTQAIEELISNIKSGEIEVKSGRIILVSVCNEIARDEGVRGVDENMNRLFIDNLEGGNWERDRANELMRLFDEVDYHLDLHSTSGKSIPFAFCEEEVLDLAKKIGIPYVITGWSNLGGDVAGDTENYMNNKGGAGITFESGNHLSPEGKNNSYRALKNFLSSYGIIDESFYSDFDGEKRIIRMSEVYLLKTNNFRYTISNVENFITVKSGTIIGYDGEEAISYNKDICLVMPTEKNFKVGEEAFFVGEIQE